MLCIDFHVKTVTKHILGRHLKSSKTEGASTKVVSNIKMRIMGLQCMWKKQGTPLIGTFFSILDSDKNYKSRKVKESIYINSLVGGEDSVNSIMNLEKGPCKLDSCWNRVYPIIRERVQNKLQRQHKKWLSGYEIVLFISVRSTLLWRRKVGLFLILFWHL